MAEVSQNSNATEENGGSVEFAPSIPNSAEPRVLPVIVQPVVPETTGAIASQAVASIPRPSEGTIRVIDTAGLAELNFNFPPSSVHIAALDVDLVMVFSDNSKLILPNLALGLLGSNPPKLNFQGKSVAAQDVIGAINQVTLADASPSIHLASPVFLPKKPKGPTAGEQDGATGQDGIGGGEPPVPPQPIVSGGKLDKQAAADQTKTGDFNSPPVKEVPAGSLSFASANSAIINPSVVTPAKNIEDSSNRTFAFDSVVTGQLLQTVGIKTSDGQIKGSTGSTGSDTNPDYSVQITKEVLTGSASGDEIWGEDPTSYTEGMAGRSLQITLPSTSVTTSKVTISGVPDGVKILNATLIGGGIYQMEVGSGNTFTMKLAYKLPSDAATTDSDGYYIGFKYTFSFEFSGVNAKGEKGTVTASATVGIRDVTSADDQIGLDTKTGKLIVGLSRDPTGNIVNAGDGNDTLIGGGGTDSLFGGAGNDSLQLDWSSINLSRLDGGSGTDTVSFANSSNNFTLSGSTFSSVLSNAEYIDFSGTSGTASVSLSGADINSLAANSSIKNGAANVIDLKFETGDSFTLTAASGYTYYDAPGGNLINPGTFSAASMTSAGAHIYVYSAGTLVADVVYHI